MSLTDDAMANVRLILNQKRRQIDETPDIEVVRLTIGINPKTRKVTHCSLNIEEKFEPAPPGAGIEESMRHNRPA